MKKSSIILLCTAFACIIIGICFCSAAIGVAGGDISNFYTEEQYVQKTVEFSRDEVTSLVFTDVSFDVRVIPSVDSMLHITYYENDKIYYSFDNVDSTLTVKYHSNAKWYDFIGIRINPQDTTVIIAVPTGFENISLQTTSGDIYLDGTSELSILKIKSTSGAVSVRSASTVSLDIHTTSGDIEIESLTAKNTDISSTSGDVETENFSSNVLEISTMSGDISAKRAKISEKLLVSTTSGNINISANSPAGTVMCEAVSGNITLALPSCESAKLTSTSGNIKMFIDAAEDYSITTSTVSGSVRVPASAHGEKEIYVKTTSGNINIVEN